MLIYLRDVHTFSLLLRLLLRRGARQQLWPTGLDGNWLLTHLTGFVQLSSTPSTFPSTFIIPNLQGINPPRNFNFLGVLA